FACPFWKNDPAHFKGCSCFRLKRIRDVEQHLKRKHSDHSHCERCGHVSRTTQSSADHCRSSGCSSRPFRRRWISESRKRMLVRRSRGSPEKQWYAIWDIIFPRETPPSSPYVEEVSSEELSSFRGFFVNHGPDVVQQNGLLESPGLDVVTQTRRFLERVVSLAYDAWSAIRAMGA
ncbi:hypothetical protein QBC34DRAFT_457447, partial [Podospora aff. communis PSN243]